MTTYLNAEAAADTVHGVDNRASLCGGCKVSALMGNVSYVDEISEELSNL